MFKVFLTANPSDSRRQDAGCARGFTLSCRQVGDDVALFVKHYHIRVRHVNRGRGHRAQGGLEWPILSLTASE